MEYFVHETSIVDDNVEIGEKTKIWHFCHVQSGARIGKVCGHEVGRWAMVAAGAVVTKNVPDYALVAGIPAKQIGWVCECGERMDESMQCSKCSRKYIKTVAGLRELDPVE